MGRTGRGAVRVAHGSPLVWDAGRGSAARLAGAAPGADAVARRSGARSVLSGEAGLRPSRYPTGFRRQTYRGGRRTDSGRTCAVTSGWGHLRDASCAVHRWSFPSRLRSGPVRSRHCGCRCPGRAPRSPTDGVGCRLVRWAVALAYRGGHTGAITRFLVRFFPGRPGANSAKRIALQQHWLWNNLLSVASTFRSFLSTMLAMALFTASTFPLLRNAIE